MPTENDIHVPQIKLPGEKGVLDGERYIEQINPIPPNGGQLVLASKVTGVHKRPSGGVVGVESTLSGTDGTIYYKLRRNTVAVGASGFEVPYCANLTVHATRAGG